MVPQRAYGHSLRDGVWQRTDQSVTSAIGTPWVGARESGYGFHSGREGHRQFTQLRVIHEPI